MILPSAASHKVDSVIPEGYGCYMLQTINFRKAFSLSVFLLFLFQFGTPPAEAKISGDTAKVLVLCETFLVEENIDLDELPQDPDEWLSAWEGTAIQDIEYVYGNREYLYSKMSPPFEDTSPPLIDVIYFYEWPSSESDRPQSNRRPDNIESGVVTEDQAREIEEVCGIPFPDEQINGDIDAWLVDSQNRHQRLVISDFLVVPYSEEMSLNASEEGHYSKKRGDWLIVHDSNCDVGCQVLARVETAALTVLYAVLTILWGISGILHEIFPFIPAMKL